MLLKTLFNKQLINNNKYTFCKVYSGVFSIFKNSFVNSSFDDPFFKFKDLRPKLHKFFIYEDIVLAMQSDVNDMYRNITVGTIKSSKEIYKSFCFKTYLSHLLKLSLGLKNSLPCDDFIKPYINYKVSLSFVLGCTDPLGVGCGYIFDRIRNPSSACALIDLLINLMQGALKKRLVFKNLKYTFSMMVLCIKKLLPLLKDFYKFCGLQGAVKFGFTHTMPLESIHFFSTPDTYLLNVRGHKYLRYLKLKEDARIKGVHCKKFKAYKNNLVLASNLLNNGLKKSGCKVVSGIKSREAFLQKVLQLLSKVEGKLEVFSIYDHKIKKGLESICILKKHLMRYLNPKERLFVKDRKALLFLLKANSSLIKQAMDEIKKFVAVF